MLTAIALLMFLGGLVLAASWPIAGFWILLGGLYVATRAGQDDLSCFMGGLVVVGAAMAVAAVLLRLIALA